MASRYISALILCTYAIFGFADELVVDGSALIRDGDFGQARELAIRRAMARAAESQGAIVNSQSIVRPGSVLESIQVRASACAGDSKLVKEVVVNSELTVTLKVTVNSDGVCTAACKSSYTNKVIVMDFGFEFPEQLLFDNNNVIKNKTAGEISRKIRKHNRLLVNFDNSNFPYMSPTLAPEPFMFKEDTETPFVKQARIHHGQYVVSGVYRDFELSKNKNLKKNRIEIEVFIHDGANGALLDRHTFTSEAKGSMIISENQAVGSPEFYRNNFGKFWGELLEDVARWTEEKVACLPFISRVVKVDGHHIYIDAGAESGLSVGDTLNLHVWRGPVIRDAANHHLGVEKEFNATASLVSVYPSFSIAQMVDDKLIRNQIRIGDLLYSK